MRRRRRARSGPRRRCRAAASAPAGRRGCRSAGRSRSRAARIASKRARWSSCVPWLKLSRKTSTPASNSARMLLGVGARRAERGDDLGAALTAHVLFLLARWRPWRRHQDGAEIVDIGQGRPGHDEIAERREKAVAVIVGQRLRADRCRPRCGPRDACPGYTIAPALSSVPSMPSVSQASACDARSAVERQRRAPAGTRCCARRARCRAPSRWSRRPTAAPPAAATRRRRPESAGRGLPGDAGMDQRDVARLALDRVAQHERRDAGVARRPRPRRRAPRCGVAIRSKCAAGEDADRRASGVSSRGGGEMRDDRRRRRRCAYLASTARASAKVVGSGTVGPEAMTAGSSPGTSEIASVTICAGAAAAASRPPLIAERCLRTQLISPMVAPAAQQRARHRLLVVERQARRRQRQQRRAAARDEHQHEIVGGRARARWRGCAPPRRCRRRRAPDGSPRRSRCARQGTAWP